MSDFKSFSSGYSGGNKPNSSQGNQYNQKIDTSKVSQSDINKVKQVASQYEGMDDNQMVAEIMRLAADSKRAGKLGNQDIHNFVNSVSPMLSPEQRAKLMRIISAIK